MKCEYSSEEIDEFLRGLGYARSYMDKHSQKEQNTPKLNDVYMLASAILQTFGKQLDTPPNDVKEISSKHSPRYGITYKETRRVVIQRDEDQFVVMLADHIRVVKNQITADGISLKMNYYTDLNKSLEKYSLPDVFIMRRDGTYTLQEEKLSKEVEEDIQSMLKLTLEALDPKNEK